MALEDGAWHLDKKIPIGLAVAILLQTVTLVYVGTTWKADIDYRLATLEKSDGANSSQDMRIAANDTRMSLLEQNLSFIKESIVRIEAKIDRQDGIKSSP